VTPLRLSLSLHLAVVAAAVLLIFSSSFRWKRTIDIEVFEIPPAANPTLNLQPHKEEVAKPEPKEKPRSVFGVSRKAITTNSETENTASVKQGNTVAKEQDDLTLNKDDADSLPIPADDYMVSNMPRLKSEIRIPYPAEAKKEGVEGPVVMDLLIDSAGKVRKVDLIKGPGSGLNEAAVAAVENFEFIPARIGEQNVAVKIRYTYRFVLENR
jgi:periplasmic protein TonB